MNYSNEIWSDVVGYEGLYKVSTKGDIKSIRRNKLLSLETNKAGYKKISLLHFAGMKKNIGRGSSVLTCLI